MNADQILAKVRPLVLVVDEYGTVEDVRGGYGGFLGYDLDAFPGSSVFDYVAPGEIDELATYFAESAGQSLDTVSLPLPLRLTLVGADGLEHPVDVIPAAQAGVSGLDGWVVVAVPVALHTSVSRSLEAEMAGESRERVRELLTEELAVDNASYTTRWFLVDLTLPSSRPVTTSRAEDRPMADAIAREVAEHDWRPWEGTGDGETAPLLVDDLPEPLQRLAGARKWRRVAVTPVHLDGTMVATYLLFGRVPAGYVVTEVSTNVMARIRRLVDATALLIARWRDRDRLVAAATRDPLTGLANRDAFADALASAGEESTLLYIDVDHFKSVNDRYGHDVGDRVLVEISRRIVDACRPVDVVARFGGDEFVVLLNGVDVEAARVIGERIVDLVGAPMIETDDLDHITVSVGLAGLVSGDNVVDSADRAMLEAKRAGRDRLVSAEPDADRGSGQAVVRPR